MDYEDWVK